MEREKTIAAALSKVDRNQRYQLEDSLRLVKETARAKFDETVEMAIRLGVDPRQADQNIRGTVTLPHGMGKRFASLHSPRAKKRRKRRTLERISSVAMNDQKDQRRMARFR